MSRYPTTLPRQSFTAGALFASPLLSESMNVSMLARSASMTGAMLPDTSMRKTMSATPLVLARGASGGAMATSDWPIAASPLGATSASATAPVAETAESSGSGAGGVVEGGLVSGDGLSVGVCSGDSIACSMRLEVWPTRLGVPGRSQNAESLPRRWGRADWSARRWRWMFADARRSERRDHRGGAARRGWSAARRLAMIRSSAMTGQVAQLVEQRTE